MTRTASCQCRAFRVIVTGEPEFINVCHCQACQRRSGVPWTCNAYFRRSEVRLEGDHSIYTRDAQEGRKFHNHFCPNCGSTVCWTLDMLPHHYGVAAGAFNDPNFPAPRVSIWEESMYSWVTTPPGIEHFAQVRPKPSSN